MQTVKFKGSPTAMTFKRLFGFEWIAPDKMVVTLNNGEHTEEFLSREEFISMMIDGLAWADGRWERTEGERLK